MQQRNKATPPHLERRWSQTASTNNCSKRYTSTQHLMQKIHHRLLQTLSGWLAAGLGLPLMIIWLLHKRALQLSRAQTLKWQQPPPPPPPAAALISSWAPRAAGLPACCAIWHTEPLTPSLCKSRDTDCLQHTFSELFQWLPRVPGVIFPINLPLYLDISQDCWVS